MSDRTIADLDAAWRKFEALAARRDVFPSVYSYDGKVKFALEFKISSGFTGRIKAEGATLSEAVFSALNQLSNFSATISGAALEGKGNE